MSTRADPALETLLLPFARGALAWPREGGALFLGGRDGWPLHAQALPGLEIRVDEDDGAGDTREPPRLYPLVLLLPPRQREQARAQLARALARLAPGGVLLACMPNKEGAKAGQDDLARLAGPLSVLTKNHCRVFWTAPLDAPADAGLAAEWRQLDAPRLVADPRLPGGGFRSRPGVFAWNRIDPASLLLAEHLPDDLRGRIADLGAGWGYLSGQVLARCPGVAALDLYEADPRALQLARENLAAWRTAAGGTNVPLEFFLHDVTTGLPRRYDAIVSNPPFHAQGAGERVDIGRAFIAAAAAALKPGGRLWLVANRHLPYESVLGASFGSMRSVAQRDGFKVIEAVAK